MSSRLISRLLNRRGGGLLAVGAAAFGGFCASQIIKQAFPPYDFRGKVVLISGGSRGLGLLLSRRFAREGARLAICSRDAEELQRAHLELAKSTDVLAMTCDVTRQDDVNTFVRAALARYGRIDVLVNNSGIIQSGPVELMSTDDFEATMRTHFWGPLYFTQAVLPSMRERGIGRIVNIASFGGKLSIPHFLPYCASKFALVGLSEGLRAELAKDGIWVTTVCPGLMCTGSARNAQFKGNQRAEYAMFRLGASVRLISMNADSAARQIVEGCRRGTAELILSLPAKVAVRIQGLCPGLVANVLGVVARFLPGPTGSRRLARGFQCESPLTRSWLTRLDRRAAWENNEMHPPTGRAAR